MPRFAKLRFSNDQNTPLQIHIIYRQSGCLAGAQARRCEQTDEGLQVQRLHPFGRSQSRCLSHEPADFILTVNMRWIATVPDVQQPANRDLMTRLNDAHPARKLTNHGQLSSPGGTLHTLGLLGPFQRQWYGDEGGLFASQEGNKLPQCLGGFLKTCPKGPSGRDVFG
jgi:hypothetical protein